MLAKLTTTVFPSVPVPFFVSRSNALNLFSFLWPGNHMHRRFSNGIQQQQQQREQQRTNVNILYEHVNESSVT